MTEHVPSLEVSNGRTLSVRAFRTILLTGLLAGTLDITAAIINAGLTRGTTATIVFQYIASGVFGRDAFSDPSMASWGIIFHYFIAYSWTVLFFLAYRKLTFAAKRPAVTGLVYGVLIWSCMNFVVLPLSNVRRVEPSALQIILGISFIMFLVGLPISLIINKYYTHK